MILRKFFCDKQPEFKPLHWPSCSSKVNSPGREMGWARGKVDYWNTAMFHCPNFPLIHQMENNCLPRLPWMMVFEGFIVLVPLAGMTKWWSDSSVFPWKGPGSLSTWTTSLNRGRNWVTETFSNLPKVTWSYKGFPCGSDSKASAYIVGDLGLIPGSGRSPGEGNGNPLQYACLENPMDRGPGRLQSMGSQRVGHNWMINTHNMVIYGVGRILI